MRRKEGRRSGFIFLLLFFGLQCIKSGLTHFIIEDYGTGRIESYPKNKVAFSAFSLSDGYKSLMPAVLGQKEYTITVKQSMKVVGVGTNAYFTMVEPLQIREGAYYGETAVNEARNVVVISDTLAKLLFYSEQVIGNLCEIEGVPYQIIGVYTRYEHLDDILFDTGEEKVYFPITSTLGKALNISTIVLPAKQQEIAINEKALNTLGINENNSLIYDAGDAEARLQGMNRVALNLGSMILILYCLIYIGRLAKNQNITLAQKLFSTSNYLIIILLTCVLGMKKLYIPSEMLPPYNIFDITYYWSYLKKQLVLHNQLLRLQFTQFENIYWVIKRLGMLITVVQILLSFRICQWIMSLVQVGQDKIRIKCHRINKIQS